MSAWPKRKVLPQAEVFEADGEIPDNSTPVTAAPKPSHPSVVPTATLSSREDLEAALQRLKEAAAPRPLRTAAPVPVVPAVSAATAAALAAQSPALDELMERVQRLERVLTAHPISEVRPALTAFAGIDEDADHRTVAAAALETLAPLDPDMRREVHQRVRRAEAVVKAHVEALEAQPMPGFTSPVTPTAVEAGELEDLHRRLAAAEPKVRAAEQLASRLATLRPVHVAAVQNSRAVLDAREAHDASLAIVESVQARLAKMAEIRAGNDAAVTDAVTRLQARLEALPPADDPRLTAP